MTISSTNRKAGPFIGNGSASVFAFSFRVFAASDLEVVRITVATGVETTLTINSAYTVSLNADQNSNPGGSITLTGGALASGYNLIITSAIANLQPTDLTNQGGFYPEVITGALDRATIQIQQLDEHVSRTLSYPITDPTVGTELPPLEQRKGTVLAFDETTGAPEAGPNVGAILTVSGNIADINTVAANISDVNIVAGNIGAVTGAKAMAQIYQGAKASDPALRNSGNALETGDLYFNTSNDRMRVYETGTGWIDYEATAQTAANTATAQAAIATSGAATATAGSVNATAQATTATTARLAAEAARDAAQLSVGVYASTTLGLAATTNGDYFSVPSSLSSQYLILYQNSTGTAVEVKRYPSQNLVEQIIEGTALSNAPLLLDTNTGVQFDFSQTDDGMRVAIKQNGVITLYDPDAILTSSSATPNVITTAAGVEEYSPHNLFLNSGAPATQNFTGAIIDETYTVSIVGSGSVSITVSLADSPFTTYGTATQAAPLTFVAVKANIRINAITGSVTRVQLNRGPTVLKYLPTTASVRYGVPISRNPANNEMMLISEPARTNYLLNSATPATQTVSLAAGTYTLWITGAGSVDLSGGPTGTATASTPVTFTLGSTTSVTFTITGTVTFFQCENGSVPSSKIYTWAAARARSMTQMSVATSALPALGSEYLIYCDYWLKTTSGTGYMFALLTDGSNRQTLWQSSGFTTFTTVASGINSQAAIGVQAAAGQRTQFTGLFRASSLSMSINGKPVYIADDRSVTLPSVTTLTLGGYATQPPTVDAFYIRRFALVPTSNLVPSAIPRYFYTYPESDEEYDIIVIAGQSNTNNGFNLDPVIDVAGKRTFQLSLSNASSFGTITGNVFGEIYAGSEPLRSPLVQNNSIFNAIGFGAAFARDYYVAGATNPWTKVLLINAGVGNTGFYSATAAENRWNPGNDLYNSMCSSVGAMLAKYPRSKVRAFLWMQGEWDADLSMSQAEYQTRLTALVAGVRAQFGSQVPVIVGGMKPAWVAANAIRQPVQDALVAAPTYISLCGYANPNSAPAIGQISPSDPHYTAAEQRTFAGKFWTAWQGL